VTRQAQFSFYVISIQPFHFSDDSNRRHVHTKMRNDAPVLSPLPPEAAAAADPRSTDRRRGNFVSPDEAAPKRRKSLEERPLTTSQRSVHFSQYHHDSSLDYDDEEDDDDELRLADKSHGLPQIQLFPGHHNLQQYHPHEDVTQPFHFSHHSDAEDEESSPSNKPIVLSIQDCADGSILTLYPANANKEDKDGDMKILHRPRREPVVYSIGRNEACSLYSTATTVSREHAQLMYQYRDESVQLQTLKRDCYVRDDDSGKWITISAHGCTHPLTVGQTFRLLPKNPRCVQETIQGVQFTLLPIVATTATNHSRRAGTASMDYEYLRLLRTLKRHGQHQNNKKGGNTTLREPFALNINLRSKDDANMLPVTTLRKIYTVSAVLEAIWYLRGEDHVQFLQRHNQSFWDRQAHEDTAWVGFNYGLLTKYPSSSSSAFINPLEEQVILPLVAGKTSRNMVCTLTKPGEPTVQQACTSSIQFAVSQNGRNEEELNLTVTQRSSDVILGLPHDVIVWSIILHLVRREVALRTKGKRTLRVGILHFCISAGGAHYYDINANNLEELLDREPIPNVVPHFILDASCDDQGLFEIAEHYESYKTPKPRVKLPVAGYTAYHERMRIDQAIDL
jgi:thymidylate synthase